MQTLPCRLPQQDPLPVSSSSMQQSVSCCSRPQLWRQHSRSPTRQVAVTCSRWPPLHGLPQRWQGLLLVLPLLEHLWQHWCLMCLRWCHMCTRRWLLLLLQLLPPSLRQRPLQQVTGCLPCLTHTAVQCHPDTLWTHHHHHQLECTGSA